MHVKPKAHRMFQLQSKSAGGRSTESSNDSAASTSRYTSPRDKRILKPGIGGLFFGFNKILHKTNQPLECTYIVVDMSPHQRTNARWWVSNDLHCSWSEQTETIVCISGNCGLNILRTRCATTSRHGSAHDIPATMQVDRWPIESKGADNAASSKRVHANTRFWYTTEPLRCKYVCLTDHRPLGLLV